MILKIQRSFPEHSIRSVESVLILERLCVSSGDLGRTTDLGDEVAEGREEALELPTDKEQLVDRKRLGGDSRPIDANGWPRVTDLSTVRVLIRDGSLRERSPRRRGTCCTSSEAGSPLSVTTDGRQSCRHREQAPVQPRPLGQST
jgi:hypothetical protein